MSRPRTRARSRHLLGAVGAIAGCAQTVLLLRRMRGDLASKGRLSAPNVAWMYATYTGYVVATGVAATRRVWPMGLPRPMRLVGGAAAAGGAALTTAAFGRFNGPAQLSGTETGPLVASGVYRYSRNPQYAGLVLHAVGVAVARNSGGALALSAALTGAYSCWIRVEERHLERVFGDSYRTFRQQTPRWFGKPVRRSGR